MTEIAEANCFQRGGVCVAGLLLNQLGNAEGAVQDWELACKHYKQAAVASPEIESLALANLALANCELGVRHKLELRCTAPV